MEPKEKKAFEPSGLVPRSIVRTFERFRQQLLPGSETAAIREYRISRYQVLVSVRCLFTLLIIPIATNWFVSSWLVSPLVEHFWNTQQNEIFLNSYQEERAFAELESFSEKLFFESLLNTTNTINVELVNPERSTRQRNSKGIVLTNNEVLNPLPVAQLTPSGLRLEDLSEDWSGNEMCGLAVSTNCVNDFTPFSSSSGTSASVTTSLIPLRNSEGVSIFMEHGRKNASTAINNLVINSESNAVDTLLGKAFDAALLPVRKRENYNPFAPTVHDPIGVAERRIQYLSRSSLLQPSYCAQLRKPFRGMQSPLQVAELIPDKSSICKKLRLEHLSEDLSGYPLQVQISDLSEDLSGVRVESYNNKSLTLPYRHIPLQRILVLPQGGMRRRDNASTATISSNLENQGINFSASDLSAHTLPYSLPLGSTGITSPCEANISFPYKFFDKSSSLNPLRAYPLPIEDWSGLAELSSVQIEDLSENWSGVSCATCKGLKALLCSDAPLPTEIKAPAWDTQVADPYKSSDKSAICTCNGLKASSVLSVPLENTYDNSVKIKEKVQNKILELAIYYNQQTIISITNIVGDVVSLITLGCLFIWMKPEITILKSFLIEAIYSLSDTTKSFLLILLTDLLVGFHSPRGWETALELLLKHFGLPENQDFVFLFVATFPVLLDTVFKYWIFRHLNKISPSTVATYHSMIE